MEYDGGEAGGGGGGVLDVGRGLWGLWSGFLK